MTRDQTLSTSYHEHFKIIQYYFERELLYVRLRQGVGKTTYTNESWVVSQQTKGKLPYASIDVTKKIEHKDLI